MNEEGFILILAGGDVSAMNLSMLTYRLLINPDILKTLTDELDGAMTGRDSSPTRQELEKLPFLVGTQQSPPLVKNKWYRGRVSAGDCVLTLYRLLGIYG